MLTNTKTGNTEADYNSEYNPDMMTFLFLVLKMSVLKAKK